MPSCRLLEGSDAALLLCGVCLQRPLHSKFYERRNLEMKKYEAPKAELELFVVENIMDVYDDFEETENNLPIS